MMDVLIHFIRMFNSPVYGTEIKDRSCSTHSTYKSSKLCIIIILGFTKKNLTRNNLVNGL